LIKTPSGIKIKKGRRHKKMTEQALIQEIHTLPESLKLEVLHFVQFLKQKQTEKSATETPRKKRKAGSAKGEIIMADDFDAPLEDFAEYM
jgi:hypothetical protein